MNDALEFQETLSHFESLVDLRGSRMTSCTDDQSSLCAICRSSCLSVNSGVAFLIIPAFKFQEKTAGWLLSGSAAAHPLMSAKDEGS